MAKEKKPTPLPVFIINGDPDDIKSQFRQAFACTGHTELGFSRLPGAPCRNSLRSICDPNGPETSFEKSLMTLHAMGYGAIIPLDSIGGNSQNETFPQQWEHSCGVVRVPIGASPYTHKDFTRVVLDLETAGWQIVACSSDMVCGNYRCISYLAKRPKPALKETVATSGS